MSINLHVHEPCRKAASMSMNSSSMGFSMVLVELRILLHGGSPQHPPPWRISSYPLLISSPHPISPPCARYSHSDHFVHGKTGAPHRRPILLLILLLLILLLLILLLILLHILHILLHHLLISSTSSSMVLRIELILLHGALHRAHPPPHPPPPHPPPPHPPPSSSFSSSSIHSILSSQRPTIHCQQL